MPIEARRRDALVISLDVQASLQIQQISCANVLPSLSGFRRAWCWRVTLLPFSLSNLQPLDSWLVLQASIAMFKFIICIAAAAGAQLVRSPVTMTLG